MGTGKRGRTGRLGQNGGRPRILLSLPFMGCSSALFSVFRGLEVFQMKSHWLIEVVETKIFDGTEHILGKMREEENGRV